MEPLENNRSDSFSGVLPKNAKAGMESSLMHDAEFEGWELSRYAGDKNLTPEQVWEKVKSGQLVARCHQGRMYVLEDFRQVEDLYKRANLAQTRAPSAAWGSPLDPSPLDSDDQGPAFHSDDADAFDEEMDIAEEETAGADEPAAQSGHYLANHPLQHPPEIALLLDHLSLAKEENKDILRLTQNAIKQITSMTTSMLSLKEELLTAKDDQLKTYKQQLEAKELQLKSLKQEVEDLKMLTSFLSADR